VLDLLPPPLELVTVSLQDDLSGLEALNLLLEVDSMH
jgi:hypothetical protein